MASVLLLPYCPTPPCCLPGLINATLIPLFIYVFGFFISSKILKLITIVFGYELFELLNSILFFAYALFGTAKC